jgi:hypothetical protein
MLTVDPGRNWYPVAVPSTWPGPRRRKGGRKVQIELDSTDKVILGMALCEFARRRVTGSPFPGAARALAAKLRVTLEWKDYEEQLAASLVPEPDISHEGYVPGVGVFRKPNP